MLGWLAAASAVPAVATSVLGGIPTQYDKYNKAEREKLENLKRTGQLGLTDAQYQARARDRLAPVRAAGTQIAEQQAAAMATAGQLGGRDLSAMRRDSQRILGEANMKVQSDLDAEKEAAAAAQQNELDARTKYQSDASRGRLQSVLGGLASVAKTAGSAAGAAPGTFTAFGLGGTRPVDPLAAMKVTGLDAENGARFAEFASQPGANGAMRDALNGRNLTDPTVLWLRQLLEAQAAGPTGGE